MARFINERLRWDDLRLFLAVARSGGLASATTSTGASPATLSRRMLFLERGLGVSLFERRPDGYDLTSAGRELIRLAETLEQGAMGVERWRIEMDPRPTVRIAAGAWTSAFIARHAAALTKPDEPVSVEILTGIATADLAHREANLGIRNRRPDRASLTRHRLGRVEFAIYGSPAFVKNHPQANDERRYDDCEWVAFSPVGSTVPSASWLEQRLQRPTTFRCSAPTPLLDAAITGRGLCILPCFIGDDESCLLRVSDTIATLSHEQWLVGHEDDRSNDWIQRVSKRLRRLFRENRELFAGETGRESQG